MAAQRHWNLSCGRLLYRRKGRKERSRVSRNNFITWLTLAMVLIGALAIVVWALVPAL